MHLGFIGLGRMGSNMVRRLLRDGHSVVAYNRSPEKTQEIAGEGATASFTIAELVAALEKPRVAWIMVPAGDATEAQIKELLAVTPTSTTTSGVTPSSPSTASAMWTRASAAGSGAFTTGFA